MQMETDSVDRISNLPDFILHKILSPLPRKDLLRTSVLSKRWNHIWEYFPTFSYHCCRNEPKLKTTEDVNNLLSCVKTFLVRLALSKLRVHKFNLEIPLDPIVSSKLYECLELALNSGASEIRVSNWKFSGFEACTETTFTPNTFNCYYFVRDLSLSRLSLSEDSIHGIIHNCPNIRYLELMCLEGLSKLKIENLDGLEELTITTNNHLGVDIDAPNLRKFYFYTICKETPNISFVNMTSGLRELSLHNLTITEEVFHTLISRLPLLEDLRINFFKGLQRVTIYAQCLKRLKIVNCTTIEAIEIDAPTLSSFRYETEILPRLFLKNIPSDLDIVHELFSIPVGTRRFLNLREFLALSTVGDVLTVRVNILKANFYPDYLRQVAIPPAFQLQHLKLELMWEKISSHERRLVDGLLWSCHPKKLSVFWDPNNNNFVKIFCKSLMEMEKHPTCCASSTVKCWRHDLKSARIEGGLEGQHWTLLLPPDDTKDSVISFNLEWDFYQKPKKRKKKKKYSIF